MASPSASVRRRAALPAALLVAGLTGLGVATAPVTVAAQSPLTSLGGRGCSGVAQAGLGGDATTWADRCGRELAVDAPVSGDVKASATSAPTGGATTRAAAAGAAAPALTTVPAAASPFTLHSRPGSHRVIYLDFVGYRAVDSAWNTDARPVIDAPPFDLDGHPDSFDPQERAVVAEVWARVAEDYSPFDVDVTTQDPGDAAIDRSSPDDQDFGTRAVITPSDLWLACGCRGIAYIGGFALAGEHALLQPAWVFADAAGHDAKGIAEVAAHEVGHTLGLHHDGVDGSEYDEGQGVWAPIMGSGQDRPLTQWSDGDYPGATNTEDDLAVITAGGLDPAPDEAGDTAATAAPLGPLGPAGELVARGAIGSRGDVDRYSFTTTGGRVTITVDPATVGADLDAGLTLLDASGRVRASADPPTTGWLTLPAGLQDPGFTPGLSATISRDLPPGRYDVAVAGVGGGDAYSAYGSLGRYTLVVAAATAGPRWRPVAPLRASAASLPHPVLRAGHVVRLRATGGTGPWRWTASGLPFWASLTPDGPRATISGRCLGRAPTNVVVTVTDRHEATADVPVDLTCGPPLSLDGGPLPAASLGRPYLAQLPAAGGTAGYVFQTFGDLPPGLSMAADGAVTGTPREAGTWTVTAEVFDSGGAAATRQVTLTVAP